MNYAIELKPSQSRRVLECACRAQPEVRLLPKPWTTPNPIICRIVDSDGDSITMTARPPAEMFITEDCNVPLGDGHSIPGFALEVPDHVYRDERRNDFRSSLGGCAEVIGTLKTLNAPAEDTFQARVMNISAGGLAVIAVDLNGHNLARGNRYRIEFELPGIKRTFEFQTELRHLRSLRGSGYILGLKFLPVTNAAQMRHAVRQISQFVSKQLKTH